MHAEVSYKIQNLRCVLVQLLLGEYETKTQTWRVGEIFNLSLQCAVLSHIWFHLEHSSLLFTFRSQLSCHFPAPCA